MFKETILFSLALILVAGVVGTPPQKDIRESRFTQVNEIDTSKYNVMDNRIENSGFSSYEELEEKKADFEGWEEHHGSTHHIGIYNKNWTIDGDTLKTRWIENGGFNATASVSQQVNLTDVDAIKLDATGTGGHSYHSKIILEIDGEDEGTFIVSPQRKTVYRDLGVNLNQDYTGEHEVRIKWIQVMGDNIGNSGIDNVKTLEIKESATEGENKLVKKSRIDRYERPSRIPSKRHPEPIEQPGINRGVSLSKVMGITVEIISIVF